MIIKEVVSKNNLSGVVSLSESFLFSNSSWYELANWKGEKAGVISREKKQTKWVILQQGIKELPVWWYGSLQTGQ